jgi:hypothetical protein
MSSPSRHPAASNSELLTGALMVKDRLIRELESHVSYRERAPTLASHIKSCRYEPPDSSQTTRIARELLQMESSARPKVGASCVWPALLWSPLLSRVCTCYSAVEEEIRSERLRRAVRRLERLAPSYVCFRWRWPHAHLRLPSRAGGAGKGRRAMPHEHSFGLRFNSFAACFKLHGRLPISLLEPVTGLETLQRLVPSLDICMGQCRSARQRRSVTQSSLQRHCVCVRSLASAHAMLATTRQLRHNFRRQLPRRGKCT